ncbi:MAG: ABC transporter ATP-binding protein [Bacilli bacterium]|nr:ABC transporter ATP-binding protein [Bacilli bacterium]
MPRPMRKPPEKSKNFLGSIKRIIKSLNNWLYLLVFALLLALVSSILAIISPDILSDLADTITDGMAPRVENISKVSEKITSSFNDEDMSNKIKNVMNDENISKEDKAILMETIYDVVDIKTALLSLPDNVLVYLFSDFEFEGVTISSLDQVKFIRIASNIDDHNNSEEMLKMLDSLPKSIYEVVEPKMNMKRIKNIGFVLIIIYLVSALFGFFQSFIMATVSNNFAKSLRSKISVKINKLPLKYFDSHETGNVLSIVTNDVDTIGMQMNQSLATLVSSLTLFIGSLIMMFITNYIMALTAIISSLFGFVFMFIILGKSQKYFNQRQAELGNMNGFIEEMYSGHNVVKVYNGTEESIEKFDELNDKLYCYNRKSAFLSGLMQPIMGFVGNFGYVAVCICGALLVMNDAITFGVIVAFMIYIRLFTNPLSQIAQALSNLQSSVAAGERVFEFLDEKEMLNEDDKKKKLVRKNVLGNIEFKNVKFGYEDDRIIINDFSVKAKSGKKIAIVGPTGAGKTTMVNLLMKFYEINEGDIIIDGISTKELTRENIHELFIMVLQDTWLFEGTIRENIRFNKKNVSDEEIWEALKTVGVDHFVKTLPGELDAMVSDNDQISQGQKQLLTIARGMIEDAPFLILDEATSNVDTRTEELVQKAMDKLTEGRTSFIIAHRLSTIKNADMILVMKDGNIIEMGNHKELMSKNGFYSDLYNSQFKK